MNITLLHNRLKIIQSVSKIDRVVINKTNDEDECLTYRGMNDDASLVLFDEHEQHFDEDWGAYSMGIGSVGTLLDRLSLFDLSAARVEVTSNEDHVLERLSIKQSRQKATYTFTPPERCVTWKRNKHAYEEVIFTMKFDKTWWQDVQRAISSMRQSQHGAESFNVVCDKKGEVKLILRDADKGDCFEYVLATAEESEQQTKWSACWKTATVQKLIREGIKFNSNGTIQIGITQRGMGIVEVDGLAFFLIPYIED